MPARSRLSELVLLVLSLGVAPAWLAACSSAEQPTAASTTTVPSCEASNTCSTGTGSLPPINGKPVVASPCGHSGSTCHEQEGGDYDGTVDTVDDAASEGAASNDAGAAGDSDASRPSDSGPG